MNPEPNPTTHKTLWHRLLGSVLEQLLTPVGITVYTDVPVMSDPPEADILLLRRDSSTWTQEQLARLPDGIRDSQASHILIEFKYTESVNEDAWLQALGYDTFYKRAKRLTATEVQTFLVSAKTPQQDTLTEYGYMETEQKGVYRSQKLLLRQITLLLLNQLPPTPHNAFIKCFASRLAEKRKAFAQLRRLFRQPLPLWTSDLGQLLSGLFKCWFANTGEQFMKQELNSEQVKQMGREWIKASLAQLSVTERLMGLKPQEVFDQFDPEKIEEYLNQLKLKKSYSKNT